MSFLQSRTILWLLISCIVIILSFLLNFTAIITIPKINNFYFSTPEQFIDKLTLYSYNKDNNLNYKIMFDKYEQYKYSSSQLFNGIDLTINNTAESKNIFGIKIKSSPNNLILYNLKSQNGYFEKKNKLLFLGSKSVLKEYADGQLENTFNGDNVTIDLLKNKISSPNHANIIGINNKIVVDNFIYNLNNAILTSNGTIVIDLKSN